jgi:hypothetical protein
LGFEILYLVGRYAENHPIKLVPFHSFPNTHQPYLPPFLDRLMQNDSFTPPSSRHIYNIHSCIVAWSLEAEKNHFQLIIVWCQCKINQQYAEKGSE